VRLMVWLSKIARSKKSSIGRQDCKPSRNARRRTRFQARRSFRANSKSSKSRTMRFLRFTFKSEKLKWRRFAPEFSRESSTKMKKNKDLMLNAKNVRRLRLQSASGK
jgi:hypothetical protein